MEDYSDSRWLKIANHLSKFYNRELEKAATEAGLCLSEGKLALFLHNNPEVKQAKEITIIRGFSKGYVSQNVKRLKEKGYIKSEVASDRRNHGLSICADKTDLIEIFAGRQRSILAEIFKGVSGDEFRELQALLEKLESNIPEDIKK